MIHSVGDPNRGRARIHDACGGAIKEGCASIAISGAVVGATAAAREPSCRASCNVDDAHNVEGVSDEHVMRAGSAQRRKRLHKVEIIRCSRTRRSVRVQPTGVDFLRT